MVKNSFAQRREDLLQEYQTTEQGLTSAEAAARLRKFGFNIFAEQKRFSVLFSFFSKFKNPLVLILLAAASISLYSGAYIDGSIIVVMVLLSVIIDFYQEYHSNKAAEKLKQKVATKVTVLRDKERKEILVSHLTHGDIVCLSIGSIIPADMKILSSNDLHIDESSLTGESFPVQKDELDDVYMGTTVMNGEGQAVVIKVGKETQFGHIASRLGAVRDETDFEKGIKEFGVLVMKITLVLVSFILIVNISLRHSIFESLLFAIALAVGLTPELLPMIITVNLSKGALRMAKKGIIVKHLPSIQNLGSMNVLCTDKTGTITENKIKLEKYENIHEQDDDQVLRFAYLNSYFQSNLKSPLDEAVLAHKVGHAHEYTKVDEIPFDFSRRSLSVVLRKNQKYLLITKGAPENILNETHFYQDGEHILPLTEGKKKEINRRFRELSKEGFRVLAIAHKEVSKKENYNKTDESELVFLGLTAFLDPPKKDVKDILHALLQSGVQLKVLTGDNEFVTQKVCEEVDLKIEGIVLGHQLAEMSDKQVEETVVKSNIFARMTPDQKERVIIALKKQGFVVGYMGDGVNDATSLRAADVGISVNNAVDVAKESADLILIHKSLAVLKEAIQEGRKTFANTIKYIFMMMGSNFGNMVSVSLASLFIPFLPILPIQILLNNLIYDVSQLVLPLDNVDENQLKVPERWDMKKLRRFILVFGPISSLFDLLTFVILLYVFHATIPFFRTAWFVESVITQSLIVLALRTKVVPFYKSEPAHIVLFTALVAVGFSIWIIGSPFAPLFQFIRLPSVFWAYLFIALTCYFVIVDAVKYWFFKKFSSS
jgi:Mg2+-importing ATPase